MGRLRRPLALSAGLLALVTLANACTTSDHGAAAPGPSRASTSASAPPLGENRVVSFAMRGGDAYAWSEAVRGTAACRNLSLLENGKPTSGRIHTEGSSFHGTVPLTPGTDQVVARCTSQDGSTQESAPLVWRERLRPGPTASIHVSTRGSTVVLDGSTSRAGEPDRARIRRYAWHEDPRHPSRLSLASGRPLRGNVQGRRLELQAPSKDGEYYVSLTVTDAKGLSDTSTTYFTVEGGVPHAVDMMHSHPSWIDSAVIYAPVPQLWGNGGPRSVEKRLPYLKRLGVNALWLWPPTEQRAFGEEYKITDYFKLDPEWGPPSAFKAMVQKAHALGMHVLIDFVPNHTSVQDPYYVDQAKYGRASHYYDFYDRNKRGRITEYTQIFGSSGLPNLNYDDPEVRRMIIEACIHWIRDYGIDGFRVDAAWGVQRRRPGFWAEWRRALKRVDPDLLLLGEASATDPAIFRGFDLAYDWTGHPGQWEWTGVFDFPEQAGSLLKPAVTNAPKGYVPDALIMRFLNNNDTSPKFVVQYGSGLTKVAATLQLTLPGVPEMFAGDEIGATYETYSNLTPIPWRDTHHLLPLYRKLISLKRHLPTLRSHAVDVLDVNADSTFAYLRPAFDSGPPVLVLLNFGDRQPAFAVTKTPAVAAAVGNGTMRDLLTGRSVRLHVTAKTVVRKMGKESMFVLVPGGR